MYLDVIDLRDFYATLPGRVVRRIVQAALTEIQHPAQGQRVLGFGFATPYLAQCSVAAERVLAFMPAGQGVLDWPLEGPSVTALVDEDLLPLPDASLDRIVMVHALEMSPRPQALMAEMRRVLAPRGSLVAVVPNRQGAWARSDLSPFGFGRPYSRGQLRDLLTGAGFEAEGWTTALHMPPTRRDAILRSWAGLDRVGRVVWPAFSGLIVVRAVKRTVQGTRVRARASFAHALRPALRPSVGALG